MPVHSTEGMDTHRIGIIGGSGLYQLEGLTRQRWRTVKTPFGTPSDQFLCGQLAGREVVFLPRHGRGHRLQIGRASCRERV